MDINCSAIMSESRPTTSSQVEITSFPKLTRATRATIHDSLYLVMKTLICKKSTVKVSSSDSQVTEWLQNEDNKFGCGSLISDPDSDAVSVYTNSSNSIFTRLGSSDEDKVGYIDVIVSRFPLEDPKLGKMMLLGSVFSCVDPILTVVAWSHVSKKYPLLDPPESNYILKMEEIKKHFSGKSQSDHWVVIKVVEDFEKALKKGEEIKFCDEYCVSFLACMKIIEFKNKCAEYLFSEAKFLFSSDCQDNRVNVNSGNCNLVSSIICAGLYPNIAQVVPEELKKVGHRILTAEDGEVSINNAQSVVNANDVLFKTGFMAYQGKKKVSQVFLGANTMVPRLAILFFGGKLYPFMEGGTLCLAVDGTFGFIVQKDTKNMIQCLRNQLNKILRIRVIHPAPVDWNVDSDETYVLSMIRRLLTSE